MRSKILNYGASLAVAALMSLTAVQGARAEISATSDPAATNTTGPLDVRIEATVTAVAVLAIQGQADGVESGGNLITYSFSGNPLYGFVSGPATPSFTLTDAGGTGYYFYDALGFTSAGVPATVTSFDVQVYENVASSSPAGFGYTGRQSDTSTWVNVSDSTLVTATPANINTLAYTVNSGYCGTTFTPGSTSAIPSCATSADLDRADGLYMPLSAVAGSTRITLIEYALLAN